MRKLIITLALALSAVGPAVASQETEVMAPVKQFVEDFNKSDLKMTEAPCADDLVIIDDFAPHVWRGAGVVSQWRNDFEAYAKGNGITEAVVILDKPRHIDVTDAHAYVVVPTKLNLKKNGELVKLTGTMTIILRKGADGWRINASAWADD